MNIDFTFMFKTGDTMHPSRTVREDLALFCTQEDKQAPWMPSDEFLAGLAARIPTQQHPKCIQCRESLSTGVRVPNLWFLQTDLTHDIRSAEGPLCPNCLETKTVASAGKKGRFPLLYAYLVYRTSALMAELPQPVAVVKIKTPTSWGTRRLF